MFMVQLLVKFRFFIQELWERKSLQILYECWWRAYPMQVFEIRRYQLPFFTLLKDLQCEFIVFITLRIYSLYCTIIYMINCIIISYRFSISSFSSLIILTVTFMHCLICYKNCDFWLMSLKKQNFNLAGDMTIANVSLLWNGGIYLESILTGIT